MNAINKTLFNIFKWDTTELIKNIIGLAIFCLGINLFIEPNHLYSGGILGLAQLINRLINDLTNSNVHLTGIMYLIINIPLFALAYLAISKSFCSRTLFTVLIQTIFLHIIPIPSQPIVSDLLTNVLIGSTLAGVGMAHILSSTGSTGGTDIIGIILTNKYKKISVGRFALCFNAIIFGISGLLYGLSTMVYSIIYSIIENMSIDKLHDQNVSTTVTLFTKNKPTKICDFIKNDLERGATYWEGKGIYDESTTYVTYVVLSRYELHRLEKFIDVNKQDVFLIKNDFVGIDGKFKKRLSK